MKPVDLLDEIEMTQPELLLPAGDPEKLKYAVAYGADAVYFGLPMASLRTPTTPAQFTPANLAENIRYCQARNVKAYITLNIFAGNRDLDRIVPHLEQLAEDAPDALIISDPGIFRLAKRHAPQIPVHLSTQANTLNTSACAFWQDAGVERVILAREVPLREMVEIHEALPTLELECFVHGSLCVAYSGRCVISDYLTDNTKNSNKGMCGNSCRWEFDLVEKSRPDEVYTLEEDEKGTYLLNAKDLCLVRHLRELKAAGICSFKIEGRTKGIHYVATVGKVYREAIDALAQPSSAADDLARWEATLSETANRGYTVGFLYGKPTEATQYHHAQSQSQTTFVGLSKGQRNAKGLLQIEGRNRFFSGECLTWLTPEGHTAYTPTQIFDIDDYPIGQVQPNQKAWLPAPEAFSEDALSWSLLRRLDIPAYVS